MELPKITFDIHMHIHDFFTRTFNSRLVLRLKLNRQFDLFKAFDIKFETFFYIRAVLL